MASCSLAVAVVVAPCPRKLAQIAAENDAFRARSPPVGEIPASPGQDHVTFMLVHVCADVHQHEVEQKAEDLWPTSAQSCTSTSLTSMVRPLGNS